MAKLPRLANTLRDILGATADRLARASGFVQRQRTLTAAAFVQTLVFGWLDDPDAPLSHLAATAAAVGCPIAAQSLDARFSEAAATLLEGVLARAMAVVVTGPDVTTGLLARFNGVELVDATVVGLPAVMAERWPGLGGNTPTAGQAALKVEVRLDLTDGAVAASRMAGRHHDQRGPLAAEPVRAGSLRVADLGYFSVERFAEIGAAGAFWLSRLKLGTVLADADGARLDVMSAVEQAADMPSGLPVRLSATHALPCRLVARRVPPAVADERRRRVRRAARQKGGTASKRQLALCDWTALVTNVPAARLAAAGAFALYRARWQIELLFKLWKSRGGLSRSRSARPWRVVCEVYAKLLAGLVAHWVTVAGLWHWASRSGVKAWAVVSSHARHLAVSLGSCASLCRALGVVLRVLHAGCRVDTRRGHPSTAQRLRAPEACALT